MPYVKAADPLTSMIRAVRHSPWESWRLLAACRGMDGNVFHPEQGRPSTERKHTSEPRQVCSRCPVQPECLEHAIEVGERKGVWGGTTENERRLLINQRITEKRARKKASA